MRILQGLLAVLAASPSLMDTVEAKPRSVSVFMCNDCVKTSDGTYRTYYEARVVVNSCYNKMKSGYTGAPGTCGFFDFSTTIDKANDVEATWEKAANEFNVKYGGKWRGYPLDKANRQFRDGNKLCYEWYDAYEPSTCS
ncbi:hypothetical protein GGI12_005544 [Dipsacomyces acuminosporus]|nr:hypothetical protein GGI12_005544 [Dipsacomyces acuminosporus]